MVLSASEIFDPTRNKGRTLIVQSINIATSGDSTILSPSKGTLSLRIVFLSFVANAAVNIILYEGTVAEGQTALTGVMNFLANGSLTWDLEHKPLPLKTNRSFVMNLSGAQQVSGLLLAYEVV